MIQEVVEEPLVTVVIPVYNRANLICDTVRSVLNQTCQNIEIIVVDDCSTEDIYERIQSLKDSRIRYIRNSKNMGANYSRNQGILHSKGRYIAFQDSADIWKPDKLEKQITVFQDNHTIDAVYCETGFEQKNGTMLIVPDKSIGDSERNQNLYHTLLNKNIIDTPGLMVKRDCLLAVGMFDMEMPRLQEWELCLRLAKQYKFQCVNEPLSFGTYRSDSISADWKKLIMAGALLIQKHREEMEAEHVILHNILNFFREALIESDNKITAEELKNEFYVYYDKDILLKYGINEGVFDDVARDYRFRKYYHVTSKLLNKISLNIRFSYDFYGISVAVYGFGTLGRVLYQELIKEKIDVRYVIDNGRETEATDVPVYKLWEIPKDITVDMIIVTPVYEFLTIRKQLENTGDYKITSLEEIL